MLLVRNHATINSRIAHLDENAAVLQQQAVLSAVKKELDGAHSSLQWFAARLMQPVKCTRCGRGSKAHCRRKGGSRGGAEP